MTVVSFPSVTKLFDTNHRQVTVACVQLILNNLDHYCKALSLFNDNEKSWKNEIAIEQLKNLMAQKQDHILRECPVLVRAARYLCT